MLSDAAVYIVSKLQQNGYAAYAVGGCVRDILMGVAPHDWDIGTSAKPDEVRECFKGERVIDTGLRFGTVTVMVQDVPIQITTFRSDGAYTDNRRPDKVAFITALDEDLARRDFTINAMAMDIQGNILDPFGGHADIMSKTIRCVGEPDERFNEDALRILRALRFSGVLGFDIHISTERSMRRLKERLRSLSAERVAMELGKLLMGKNVQNVLMRFPDILCVVIPELTPLMAETQDVSYIASWVHTARAVGIAPKDPPILWALLLHGIHESDSYADEAGCFQANGQVTPRMGPSAAQRILRRLKLDNRTIATVDALIMNHSNRLDSKIAVKRCLNQIGPSLFNSLLDFIQAGKAAEMFDMAPLESDKVSAARAYYHEIIQNGECYALKDLAVSGQDLMALGIRGERLGNTLRLLLGYVMEDAIPNTRAALLHNAAGIK